MPDFDDPFARPDPTRLRPRPGAGKRASPDVSRPQSTEIGFPRAESIPEALHEGLGIGLNPLVQAATPLLLLAGRLRNSVTPFDVASLRRHALEELRRFEERAHASGVRHEVVLAARYVLCASVDEAVLTTPWGAQSDWSQHSLLVTLHREAWGGEKFFEMLERTSSDPSRHIDLMELQYLVLAFGFTGKYQVSDRGHERLADVQHDLYRRIRGYRGTPAADLSLRWRGVEDRRNPLIRYVPWWVVGAAAIAILAVAYASYYTSLASAAAPVHAELSKVGLEDFNPIAEAPPPQPRGPTLKQLLAPEEQRGVLSVEEQGGGRTLVTLLASDLFESGSAEINATHLDALQRLANALNQVPGRVLVVGHTDSQRVRSLRYQDNFELSRARAVNVVNVLKPILASQTGLTWTGVGASEPRYRPESDPQNQARNRRVEIIHLRAL